MNVDALLASRIRRKQSWLLYYGQVSLVEVIPNARIVAIVYHTADIFSEERISSESYYTQFTYRKRIDRTFTIPKNPVSIPRFTVHLEVIPLHNINGGQSLLTLAVELILHNRFEPRTR
jgi:hypothetical protein